MTLKFNLYFFAWTLFLLVVEVCIALYIKDGFIRHTFGDFLVVILVYCGLRSFVKISPITIAIVTIAFSFTVEFLQLFNLLEHLGLEDQKLAIIILGSTFHISDLIAYVLGTLTVLFIDLKTTSWKP